MGVWMALRGHPLRHNVEMSSTSVIAAVLLIVAYWWFGFTADTRIPGWLGHALFQCGPTCALMGAYMLLRHEHYAATTAHQVHETT